MTLALQSSTDLAPRDNTGPIYLRMRKNAATIQGRPLLQLAFCAVSIRVQLLNEVRRLLEEIQYSLMIL